MKKFLHEPLLHFLLLGAVIFAAYGLLNNGFDEDRERIVVTQGQIASMTEGYARTRQRAPTPEELEGLIRDRVLEEAYVREAQALGLDRTTSSSAADCGRRWSSFPRAWPRRRSRARRSCRPT